MRVEKARVLAAELPRYIGMFRLNPIDIHAVRQKNREPRLRRGLFRIRFVNLDFDLAGFNVNIAEPPLPDKHSPWIKPGSDSVSIDEFQRSHAVPCVKAFGLRRQRARLPDRRVR